MSDFEKFEQIIEAWYAQEDIDGYEHTSAERLLQRELGIEAQFFMQRGDRS